MEEVKRCSRCHSSLLYEYFEKNRQGKYYKTCNSCRGITKKCYTCKKVRLLSEYNINLQTKTENKTCNHCKEHNDFLSKHGSDDVNCVVCNNTFKQRTIITHMITAHRPDFRNVYRDFIKHPSLDKKYCIYCKTFIFDTSLMGHLRGTHKKNFTRDEYYEEVSKLKSNELFSKRFYDYHVVNKYSIPHIARFYK